MTDDVEIVRALLKFLYEQQCSHNNLTAGLEISASAPAPDSLELPGTGPEHRKPLAQCGI
jgi:hypothetical protein